MTDLPNLLGGHHIAWRWRDHTVRYVRRGSGPAVLLIHAIHAAAWSMEWRHVVPALAKRFTVFAPDLLGFGHSDRPSLHYTSTIYRDMLGDFLHEVIGEPTAVVGSSLSGAYALALAADHPHVVSSVSAVGPSGLARLSKPGGAGFGILQSIFRAPVVGAVLFGGLVSKPSIRFFLKDIYADSSVLTPELLDAYWTSANQPGARWAPAAFVGMRLNCDLRPVLPRLTVPVQFLWGEKAQQTPIREAGDFVALVPGAVLDRLPGGDLPHEERPEQFLAALEPFLETHRPSPVLQ